MFIYLSVYFFVSAWDDALQFEMLLLKMQGTQKKHLNCESLRCVFSFTSFEKEKELSGIFILNMHRCSFKLQSCPPSRQREPWAACWRRIQANTTPLFFKFSGLSPPPRRPPLPCAIFQKASQPCILSSPWKCLLNLMSTSDQKPRKFWHMPSDEDPKRKFLPAGSPTTNLSTQRHWQLWIRRLFWFWFIDKVERPDVQNLNLSLEGLPWLPNG